MWPLRPADGESLQGTDKLHGGKMAAIRSGHANDLGAQRPHGRATGGALVEGRRWNLQSQTG